MALFASAPHSLCIVRLSAIGDVCNTIAAVQMIQQQWPETQITWITGKVEALLIQDLPNIDVVVFDKKLGWKAYVQLWSVLKNKNFDALLHMQYAIRASIATLGIRAKYKLGFDSKRSRDFQTLFTNYKVPSPNKHHVLDGLIAFVKELGVEITTPTWNIPLFDQDIEWAKKQLSSYSCKNLVIVPGASKAYKNWNVQGYIDVINYAQSVGWTVTLAGSSAKVETDLANEINAGLSQPVQDLVGKSSLKEMLALLKHANLVIAPDTGPAHMANAVNTPIIGLYAHHNPDRTCPYQYHEYVVSAYDEAIKAETGKGKNELSWRTRVKDTHAMNRISSEQVIAMFKKATADFSL